MSTTYEVWDLIGDRSFALAIRYAAALSRTPITYIVELHVPFSRFELFRGDSNWYVKSETGRQWNSVHHWFADICQRPDVRVEWPLEDYPYWRDVT